MKVHGNGAWGSAVVKALGY